MADRKHSPFSVPVPGPDVFSDDELPTRPGGLAARASVLASNWRLLPQVDQMFLERLSAVLPSLSDTDRSWLRQIVDVMVYGGKS